MVACVYTCVTVCVCVCVCVRERERERERDTQRDGERDGERCLYLYSPWSEQSSNRITSWRYCGGVLFTTLCAVLRIGERASLLKISTTLIVGRSEGYTKDLHLEPTISLSF